MQTRLNCNQRQRWLWTAVQQTAANTPHNNLAAAYHSRTGGKDARINKEEAGAGEGQMAHVRNAWGAAVMVLVWGVCKEEM